MLGAFDSERRAEQHNGDFDVEFGTDCVSHQIGEARQKISHDEAGEQRHDESGFTGQIERPGDAKLFQFSRRRRQIGAVAQGETGVADEEDQGKTVDEFTEPDSQRRLGRHREDPQQQEIGQDQRSDALHRRIIPGDRRHDLRDGRPDVRLDGPAQHVRAPQAQQ